MIVDATAGYRIRAVPTRLAFAGVLAALLAGAVTAVSPTLAVGAIAGCLAIGLAFVLPESLLLAVFLLITLSGFRPLPPIAGFHIQAQYFLLLPMLLRSLLTRKDVPAATLERWRPLVWAAGGVVLASLASFGLALSKGNVTATIGNYIAWLMAFVFLGVLVRLARGQGPDFARVLYASLVNVIGLFAAITLLGALLHFKSLSDASSARLTFSDLNPNQTGIIIVAGLLLAIAPMTVRRVSIRDLVWLPFLLPLLVLTGSRDSIAAFVFGLVVLLFQRRSGRSTAWYLYALVGLIACVLILVDANENIVPRSLLRDFSYPEVAPYRVLAGIHLPQALAERVYIQVTAFHQFLQHPLLGVGFQQNLYIPEGTSTTSWWGPLVVLPVAHDAFLTDAAQQGILGLGALLVLVGVALRGTRAAVRAARASAFNYDIAVGVRCTVLALIFTAFNNDSLYQDFKISSLFFWLLGISFLIVSAAPKSAAAETPASSAEPEPTAPLPFPSRRAISGTTG